MAVIPAPSEPTHEIGHARFTSLATPSRGSRENSVWTVEIEPSAPPTRHSLTREEIFVVLSGRAEVDLAGITQTAALGDAIVVPPDVPFSVTALGDEPLRMVCCLPVGGQACTAQGSFVPPWAR